MLPRTSRLASHLIVGQLLALVGAHEAVHAEQVNVPLVRVLLQLADLESRLGTGALDASDNGVPGEVCRALATVEQLLGIVLVAGEFLDLVFEQRCDGSRIDEVQESDKRQETRQDRRETHVRRSLNDRKLPESERGAGEKVDLGPEVDVQAWSGGRSGVRRDTQARAWRVQE